MSELGKAYVQIVPSAEGIAGSISKVLKGESTSAGTQAGNNIASGIKGVIAKAAIGATIAAGIKKSIGEGAELQQNLGGTEAVFGKFADTIQSKSTSAYRNMGLSASDYMATANKMGSLFQGSGVSQQRSLDLTSKAMQRAADVASVMGVDTGLAMESIAGAAKGNFTMMDNLGVAMNATTLQAYALEKGINFDWKTASNAEKSELAMKMFFDRTSQYAGNFARESDETLSGSLGAMKAAFSDFMGNLSLGNDITGPLTNLVSTTKTFLVDNLLPAIGNVFSALPTVIATIAPSLASSFGSSFDGLVSVGTEMIGKIAEGLPQGIPRLLNQVMPMLSSFSGKLREGAGKLVDAGLNLLLKLAQGIANGLPALIKNIPTIVSNIAGIISDNMPKILATGVKIIIALVKGIISAIPTLIANIPKILKAIVDVFMAFSWINLGKIALSGISKGLAGAVGIIKGAMGKVRDGIVDGIKGAVGKVTGIVRRIKSAFNFGGIAGKVRSAFNAVKTAITHPITTAKNTVTKLINKVKGLFPLKIGKVFSGIKLPHFSVSGGKAPYGLMGKGVKPSFSVSWNRKAMENPWMFTGATLFGAGEAGDEVMYGKAALMRDIERAVGKAMSVKVTRLSSRVDDVLGALTPNHWANFQDPGSIVSGQNISEKLLGSKTVTINAPVTVDGAENPEQFATRFVRQLDLEMRMV